MSLFLCPKVQKVRERDSSLVFTLFLSSHPVIFLCISLISFFHFFLSFLSRISFSHFFFSFLSLYFLLCERDRWSFTLSFPLSQIQVASRVALSQLSKYFDTLVNEEAGRYVSLQNQSNPGNVHIPDIPPSLSFCPYSHSLKRVIEEPFELAKLAVSFPT